MKVGDYCRTRWGCIAKFEGIHERFYEFDNIIMDESMAVREELFVNIVEKTSPNIIDLIEVGDYVNGEKVCYLKGQIDEKEVAHEEDVLYTEYNDEYGDWYGYAEDEIETIVTHEQFSQMEYKVGEQ